MALRLEDIELIKQLKHRYMRCLDTADTAGLRKCLADDVSIRYIGGSYRIEAQGADEIVAMLAGGMYNDKYIGVHTVHHPEIDVHDETTASGIWYLVDWAMNFAIGKTTEGSAIYHDKYVKKDGAWLIQHSEYSRIYERFEDIEGKPNITAHLYAKMFGKPS
jgi:hypothetical protein